MDTQQMQAYVATWTGHKIIGAKPCKVIGRTGFYHVEASSPMEAREKALSRAWSEGFSDFTIHTCRLNTAAIGNVEAVS